MPPNQQNPYNQAPQQNTNGGYDVVPPLPVGQNAGHSGHNPYEFIVNPQATRKSSGFNLGGSGFGKRIAVLVGGAILLIVVATIVISLLSPKSPTASLIAIVQRQQEIIRLSSAAENQATGQDTQNFVSNVMLSVSSNQQQILNYLASHGTKKLKPKVLALDQNTQTDTLLNNAASINTYDTAVIQVLDSQLVTYQGLLKTTFNQTDGPKLKQILQQSYNAAGLLSEQSKTVKS